MLTLLVAHQPEKVERIEVSAVALENIGVETACLLDPSIAMALESFLDRQADTAVRIAAEMSVCERTQIGVHPRPARGNREQPFPGPIGEQPIRSAVATCQQLCKHGVERHRGPLREPRSGEAQ